MGENLRIHYSLMSHGHFDKCSEWWVVPEGCSKEDRADDLAFNPLLWKLLEGPGREGPPEHAHESEEPGPEAEIR